MLQKILVGLIVAVSFPIGAFIYTKTKEELDPVFQRFAHLSKLKPLILVVPALLGFLLASFFSQGAAVTVFGIGLLIGSSLGRKEDIKLLASTITIFVLFTAIAIFLYLPKSAF